MILKSQDFGFQFICKHCHQYAKNPTVCDRCETLYCYECLNQQSRQYKFDYQYTCSCEIKYSQTLHCVEQYVANQLSINCSICGQLKSINKIKSHQANCHQKEQEAFNFFQYYLKFQIKSTKNQQLLICSCCNQNQFEKFYLVKKHNNDQIVCRKCIYFYFNPDQKYSANMSEELVCSFQQLQLQCSYCMKKGNYYEILNHNLVCSQYFTECQCGWSSRRSDFLDHFKLCSIQNLEKLYLQLEQAEQVNQIIKFQQQNGQQEYNCMSKKIDYILRIYLNYRPGATIVITYEDDEINLTQTESLKNQIFNLSDYLLETIYPKTFQFTQKASKELLQKNLFSIFHSSTFNIVNICQQFQIEINKQKPNFITN
ncbi:hypothetical protein pb186bvf_011198 [Paramecium bursaria]